MLLKKKEKNLGETIQGSGRQQDDQAWHGRQSSLWGSNEDQPGEKKMQ